MWTDGTLVAGSPTPGWANGWFLFATICNLMDWKWPLLFGKSELWNPQPSVWQCNLSGYIFPKIKYERDPTWVYYVTDSATLPSTVSLLEGLVFLIYLFITPPVYVNDCAYFFFFNINNLHQTSWKHFLEYLCESICIYTDILLLKTVKYLISSGQVHHDA